MVTPSSSAFNPDDLRTARTFIEHAQYEIDGSWRGALSRDQRKTMLQAATADGLFAATPDHEHAIVLTQGTTSDVDFEVHRVDSERPGLPSRRLSIATPEGLITIGTTTGGPIDGLSLGVPVGDYEIAIQVDSGSSPRSERHVLWILGPIA